MTPPLLLLLFGVMWRVLALLLAAARNARKAYYNKETLHFLQSKKDMPFNRSTIFKQQVQMGK